MYNNKLKKFVNVLIDHIKFDCFEKKNFDQKDQNILILHYQITVGTGITKLNIFWAQIRYEIVQNLTDLIFIKVSRKPKPRWHYAHD